MKLTFLGTGTSTGVPQLRCHCNTCSSADPRDKRFRASALLTLDSGKNILIDCGPDFRSQILRAGSPELACLLITHSHFDHVGGLDDLRPYCKEGPFPLWCKDDVARDIRNYFPWSFAEHLYPGVPTYDIHSVKPFEPFYIDNTKITPVIVFHARLPILGYRFDAPSGSLAYITDCKTMPEQTIDLLHGVDILVINALRYEEHISHMTVEQALAVVSKIMPGETYFTHICHRMGCHADVSHQLPPHVHLAYDGLTLSLK